MKKIMIPLLALLAAVVIAAGMLPWGLPGETMVPGAAECSDGSVVVAENRDFSSRIYTLRSGAVSEIYRESRYREEKVSTIDRVIADGNQVWFLRTLEGSAEWMLMALEQGEARMVARGVFEDELRVTGMSIRDGVIWITGILENGAITVYEYTGGGTAEVKFIIPVWWMRNPEKAEYDGSVIWVTNQHGEACTLTPTGEITYLDEAGQSEPMVKVTGSAWFFCKAVVLAGALLAWLMAAVSILVTARVSSRAGRLASRLTAAGAEVLLLTLASAVVAVFFAVYHASGLVQAVQAIRFAAVAAVVIWLIGVLLLWCVARNMTAGIVAMARQMNEITDGHVKPRELAPGRDELSRMNQAMQEMCMSLSIRDYEMSETIRSYKRFVPQRLTRMLGRATIAEVSLGDSRRIVTNVGLFTVGNRDEVRSTLEDKVFVDFINETFTIFNACVQENHGSLISCTLRLSCMETMFPENPADGVRAGLDFLGRVGKKSQSDLPIPSPMMILHKASFLYGVAGKPARLFPYISSAEMEFLEGYTHKFHESGTRLVMTETYLAEMKNHSFAVRYIGFISDGDKNAYKLYEVLDVYPETERKLRIEYDRRFQEAIKLFYHNDFFLARNLFSTLLRVCPNDGIVRWYLFACEHCFNRHGDEEVDYRLFGIEDT